MRILLDTHIALWALADPKKLSKEMKSLLETEGNEVYYSVASVWEVAIKHKVRPQSMPIAEEDFVDLCDKTGFIYMPIKNRHIFYVKTLVRPQDAPKHNDPFDRILLAQAKSENLKFMTNDSLIPYYGEPCILQI